MKLVEMNGLTGKVWSIVLVFFLIFVCFSQGEVQPARAEDGLQSGDHRAEEARAGAGGHLAVVVVVVVVAT